MKAKDRDYSYLEGTRIFCGDGEVAVVRLVDYDIGITITNIKGDKYLYCLNNLIPVPVEQKPSYPALFFSIVHEIKSGFVGKRLKAAKIVIHFGGNIGLARPSVCPIQ